jgi:hypothetical protein
VRLNPEEEGTNLDVPAHDSDVQSMRKRRLPSGPEADTLAAGADIDVGE